MVFLVVVILLLAVLCLLFLSKRKEDPAGAAEKKAGSMVRGGSGSPGQTGPGGQTSAGQASENPSGKEILSAGGRAEDRIGINDGNQAGSRAQDRAGRQAKDRAPAGEADHDQRREARTGQETETGMKKNARPRPVRTEKEEAASEIYDCINKGLRLVSNSWVQGELGQLKELGSLSLSVDKYYEEILQGLQDRQKQILSSFRDAVCFEKQEDRIRVGAGEDTDLEQLLFDSMMPFYPYYGKELHKEGIRYGSILSKDVLDLFHQLTGRKFRMGFHRRYRNGLDSFDWKDNHYTVRNPEGNLLCDADFEDGKMVRGFARLPAEETGDDGWQIYKEGIWEDGSLKEGRICYHYQKKIY